ncbi:hypothetical protein ACN27F_22075 [Solwaraspora sp. WMMB335]|uniref:hypothetical protein n=1 Tax=Solwaraspora sp. WMMB335 TaxID=3404118 RepID=UPI003B952B0F
MAFRTWLTALSTAFGAAAFAGAVQLGIGYGFGIVRLDQTFVGPTAGFWPAQLAWIAWFAIVATVAGATVAEAVATRVAQRGHCEPAGRDMLRWTTFSLVAAAGAALAVAGLTVLPAASANGPTDPGAVVVAASLAGTAVGALAGVAALIHPVIRWSATAFTVALWLLAAGSVLPVLPDVSPAADLRPGVLDPAGLGSAGTGPRTLILLPVLALLLGATVSGMARWLVRPTLPGSMAGMAGPAVLSTAYLVAGAGGPDADYLSEPYWAALLAVAAGAAGSIGATAVRWPAVPRRRPAAPAPAPALLAAAPQASRQPAAGGPTGGPTRGQPQGEQPADEQPAVRQPAAAEQPTAQSPETEDHVADRPPEGGRPGAARPEQQHPGNAPPPTPVSVLPRAEPTPVAAAPAPVPVTTVDRPAPQPITTPPSTPAAPAPPSTPAAPSAPDESAAARRDESTTSGKATPAANLPRQRRARGSRSSEAAPAPPPRPEPPHRTEPPLTDEDKAHVDWISELGRPGQRSGRQPGDQASGR